MASSGSIWVSLGLKTSEFTKGIKRSRKELNGFQKFGQGLKGMFNPMSVGIGVVAGLGVAVTDAVQTFKAFEKANSDLKAVLGGTDAEMKALSGQAKALGASTAFTATEVAGLQKEFAKLGFDSSQIENMTEATLNLAAAAGTELADAASNAGAIIRAFGLQSSDATHVTDVMAASFSKSALDMEKLSETMKTAAPIARATGVSLETATAAAGKLADANISGSKAGTDLKAIFSELVKDGKPFADSLNDIAVELNGASTKADKLAIAEKLVGERAKGALLILADQKDNLGSLTTELEKADGAAKAMADTMLDNLTGDMTKAGSAWEGFILSLEDGSGVLSKAMRAIVQAGTGLLSLFTDLNAGGVKAGNALKTIGNAFLKTSAVGQLLGAEFEVTTDKIANFEGAIRKSGGALLQSESGLKKVVDKFKSYGMSSLEAAKATKKLKDELFPIKEVMPKVGDGAKKGAGGVKELTKEEEKAALEARNLKGAITDYLNVLDEGKFKGVSEAVKGVFDDIKKKGEEEYANRKPIPLKVAPKLEITGGGAGMAVTSEMIELGQQAGAALSNSLQQAAQGALVGLGEAIGAGGMENMGEQLLAGFANLLSSFGQQMIALGLGMIALKAALALGPLGAGLAIAGGVALVAIASGISSSMEDSSTGFAAGGLVTGSVFANVGEGRGTTRNNPEVISPLDKLKDFIQPQGGGGMENVKFRIQGTDLVGILERTNKINSYSS
ncbi:MAG: phage tail tape measure protein [Proteobacteria bacterium]|nr:phage tail tape measure protein [Pseudomonadota bacterium]